MRAIPAPGAGVAAAQLLRQAERLGARAEGAGGLGYIVYDADGPKGPIARNLEADRAEAIRAACGLQPATRCSSSPARPRRGGEVRRRGAHAARPTSSSLVETDAFRFCWITDFPMYELNEETGQIDFSHNPFSMPQGGLEALNTQDPLTIKAFQYDIVCNGVELSLGRDPQPPPGHHGPRLRDRRLSGPRRWRSASAAC